MPACTQPGGQAVDAAGSPADPVQPIQRVFFLWDAADDMRRVGAGGPVSVPGGFDPHGGDDAAWAMGGGHSGGMAAATGGIAGRRRGHWGGDWVAGAAQPGGP